MHVAVAISGRRALAVDGVLTVAALALLAVLVVTDVAGLPTPILANDVGLTLGGLAVLLSSIYAALRGPRRQRRSWTLFSIGGAGAVLGNGWYLVGDLQGAGPAPWLGDIALFAGSIIAVAGMITFPALPRRGIELLRMILDGVIVAGSVMLTVAVFALGPILDTGQSPFGRADQVALLIADTVVATVAGLLLIRGDRSDRPVQLTLGLGFLLWAITDLTRWVLTAHGWELFETPLPLLWIVGYATIAFAGRLTVRTRTPVGRTAENQASPIADTVISFGLLVVAAIANAFRTSPTVNSWVGAIWLVLIAAVVIRQLALIMDNDTLRRNLEGRVRSRTRELASMTRRSELLLNSVGDGIYGVDSRGVITFANPSTSQLLGYSSTEMIGRHAHDQFHAPMADGKPYDFAQCYIYDAIHDGVTTTTVDDTYVRSDGRSIPVEVTSSPLHGGTPNPGAVIVFRDMTQRREVERMKKEFVSVVSHELRTPLTSIRGSLGLLASDRLGELSESAKRMIRIALGSTERLGRLVNDILDMERLESGSIPMDFDDHESGELIETAVAQLRPMAADVGVTVTAAGSAGPVSADADRIVQTLVNLIGNAIKFSSSGATVTVRARQATADEAVGRDLVTFSVTDQGRGIPADKLEQIFERFEQVDSSDDREKGGSGLGLAISRSIVERHSGRIWAESPPGGGASFLFTLPRSWADDQGRPTPSPPEPHEQERHERGHHERRQPGPGTADGVPGSTSEQDRNGGTDRVSEISR